jgi:hypothetical protein
MHAEVRTYHSASELEVAKLDKDKEIELANISAEAHAEVTRIRAEMEAFVLQTKATTRHEVATANAQALGNAADAEGIASTKLRSRRDFEAKMNQLRVMKNLALNDRVAIAGKNTDSVVAQLLASKNATVALGLNSE